MRQLQVVKRSSPLLVPKDDAAELKKRIIYSLAGIKDLGNYAEPAAIAMAQLALSFNLNPFNQELWVLPQKRGDNVTGFNLFVGYKGLHRAARTVARQELHTDFIFGKVEKLEPEDVISRGAHRCFRCNGTGKLGKSYNCFKCEGKGTFDPKDVITIRIPVVLFSKKRMADEVGVEFEPTWGIGVWQPGDNIAEARDAEWQATKRAKADALRQEFDLPFSYGEQGNYADEESGPQIIMLDPNDHESPAAVEAARMAGISYDDEAAFIEAIDDAIERLGYESEGHVMEALVAMDHRHLSADDLAVTDAALESWLNEAQHSKVEDAANEDPLPQKPQDLLKYVNQYVEDPYDHKTHLANAIKQELGEDWNWPKFNDLDGWREAKDAAIRHREQEQPELPL